MTENQHHKGLPQLLERGSTLSTAEKGRAGGRGRGAAEHSTSLAKVEDNDKWQSCHLKIHAWWKSTNIQRKKWVRYKLKCTSKILGTGSPIYLGAEVKIISLDKFRKLAQVIKRSCDRGGVQHFSPERHLKIIRQSEGRADSTTNAAHQLTVHVY